MNELRDWPELKGGWPELEEDQRREFVRITYLCHDVMIDNVLKKDAIRKMKWCIVALTLMSISLSIALLIVK